MLKYDNTVSSTATGQPIYGAQVTVFEVDANNNNGAQASIYADEAGTMPLSQPILTDQAGYFAFYIGDGKYNISVMTGTVEISRTNITMVDSLQLKQRALLVPVNESSDVLPSADARAGMLLGFDPVDGSPTALAPNSFPGPTGPADNTYTSYAAMQASDPTRKSARLVGDTDVPPHPDGPYSNPTQTIGGWVPQGADGVSYKLPAQAAQPQSQSDKNAQTVDFFDALTPAMRASVNSGNLAVDCSPALNAITTFAYGGESQGDATGGTTLFIKGGRYRLNDPIKNTYRRDNAIMDDGDLRRLNIQGDGTNSTALFYFGPAGSPAIETAGYRGTTVNDGVKLRQKISGIWLRRWPISSKTGIGMQISHAEGMMLDDVIIDGFEVNMLATDVLEFYARQAFFKDCVVGVRMQLSDFTNPNVIEFNGGGISGATALGMHLVRPANAIVKGGFRAEGNGFDPNFQLFLIELGTPEGGFSFGLYDSYLENNMGAASVTLAHGFAFDAMVEIARNTIHNDSSTRYMQHHVDYARFGAAATANSNCVISHGPQRYRNIGTYVSDPSRSAVRLQTPGATLVEHPGNKYPSDNERPETNGFTTIGMRYPVLQVSVAADGSYDPNPLTSLNVQSITKTGTGAYRILYKTMPRQPLNVHVSIEQNNGFGFSTFVRASTYVDVLTTDATGNPTDRAFSILVQGDYP